MRFITDSTAIDSVAIPLRPLIDQVSTAHANAYDSQIPVAEATFEYDSDRFKTKVVMLEARLQRQDSTIVANSYDALIFYSRKSTNWGTLVPLRVRQIIDYWYLGSCKRLKRCCSLDWDVETHPKSGFFTMRRGRDSTVRILRNFQRYSKLRIISCGSIC